METASFTSHIRCMCDVLSERGDECCAVTLRILVFKLTFDVHTIASASSGASMDARYHLGASGIFCGLLDRPIVRVNLETVSYTHLTLPTILRV